MDNPLIRKLKHFAPLSSAERQALHELCSLRPRIAEARTDIVREGDKPRFVNLFLDGWACRYKTLEDGRRQIIAFFVPGDLCDLNVFVLREFDHSISALTRTSFVEIPQEALDQLTNRFPRLSDALWWEALSQDSIQREWAVNLGQRSAPERIAHLICELFIRRRAQGLAQENRFHFPITQADLGDATGLSLVHVNRTVQDLRRDGLVIWRGSEMEIPNLDALMRHGLFNPNYLHLAGQANAADAGTTA